MSSAGRLGVMAMPATLPVVIIIAALVAMLLVPMVSARRTAVIQEDLRTVAEPARGEITQLHLAIAQGEAALRDYLESQDPAFLAAYHHERTEARGALTGLEALSTRLGPDVDRWLDSLRVLGDRWEQSSGMLLVRRGARAGGAGDAPGGAARPDSLHQEIYTATLLAAARLDATVARVARQYRQRILAAERAGASLTLALGALALAGAAAAWWLGHNLRRHALAAERGHREARHAMESKARLMRGLSHDLKNPLNAIDGHAQLIEAGIRGPVTAEQQQSIERIRRSVRSLLALVVDLLDLAAAESHDLRVERRPTDVGELVHELVEEHRAAAEAAGLHLSIGADDVIAPVVTDAARVRQVVGNLLSNAVKYTPASGHVSVWMRPVPGDVGGGRRPMLRIAVSDTGPGVPPDARERIFDEFVRLHDSTTPGAGLGLAISRHVARALGGDVRLEPTTGSGATFVFELPLERRDGRRRSA